MQYVYLNVFVNALSALFEFIFHDVLSPILTEILKIYASYVGNTLLTLLSNFVFILFSAVCSLVDFVEGIFNIFAGISPVKYGDKTLSLTEVLFEMEAITTAFWVITLFSLFLCIIFTIFQTAKSVSDMALDDKNPISKVLTDAMKAGITFFLIPFLCVMMLQLSSIITKQADAAFQAANGGKSSLGTILFLSATLDADKATTKSRRMSDWKIEFDEGRPIPSFDDEVRRPYMEDPSRYRDIDEIKGDFHALNVNYIVGFVSAGVLLFILSLSILTFVRRTFELLLLYIVSPVFVSTIPLDDGATFARWRELFIGKFFSGFGTIFAMKYYLMVVPFLADSRLVLYPKDLPGGFLINTLLQLFLIIGGAWAVLKGQSLILELWNPEAAKAEKEGFALATGAIIGAATTAAAVATTVATGGAGAGAAAGMLGAAGSVLGGAASSVASQADENQAYRG